MMVETASAAQRAHRVVRSFVRREGRITPAQEQALARLWPRYGFAMPDASTPVMPFDPHAIYGRLAPLSIEIGFGNGEALANRAAARPQDDFFGIEVHRPGVGRLLQRAEQLDLGNLRVACADAVTMLRDALPAASVDEVMIFFPDPWPKKRHHKRRLIQPEFARLLVRVLKPGGRLRLATDWADYARHMLGVLEAEPELVNRAGAGTFLPGPRDRPPTRFEQRGLQLGHEVFDLEYRRR
jgi:tRNA (guanine-N7-)-methyltransferase